LQSILKEIPIDKIFLETDDTDFDIAELYQKVSEIKRNFFGRVTKKRFLKIYNLSMLSFSL
jgi:Tat protein secretion system quality control protein TatD with DNase activity